MSRVDRITGYVGLDLSLTCTGFARANEPADGSLYHEAITTKVPDGTRLHRCKQIANRILLMTKPTDIFFIEDYAYGVSSKGKKQASSLAQLGELNGIVKLMIKKYTGTEAIPVPIGSWKKFLSGSGNLPKDEFKLAVYKTCKLSVKTNDEAAALGILYMAVAALRGRKATGSVPLKAYQIETLTKFRKDKAVELQTLANFLHSD